MMRKFIPLLIAILVFILPSSISYAAIAKWAGIKGISLAAVSRIYNKLKNKLGFYGKPYVYWTEGNNLRREDFAGYTARKYKSEVADKLAHPIGKDVAEMITKQIRKNNPKANV